MAHTISRKLYCEEEKKYVECEILVLDEEENLPDTDRREIMLTCQSCGNPIHYGGEGADNEYQPEVEDFYEETALIDQYSDLDADKTGYSE